MRLLSSLYAVTFAPAVVAFVAPSIIQPVENCNHQLPQLFTHRQRQNQCIQHFSTSLWAAKPQRLQENVPGVVYVNDRCINCAACSAFAPATFDRNEVIGKHIVHQQPKTQDELVKARAALAACPVAAIRVETLAERRHRASTPTGKAAVQEAWTQQDDQIVQQMSPKAGRRPFPRPLFLDETSNSSDSQLSNPPPVPDVYWTGHHNEASFGAVPFLMKATYKHKEIWIMIDTPKFSKAAVDDVVSVTGERGPDFLFLTHVDDTAGHGKWANHFPSLREIFHSGDLGRHNWIGDRTLEAVDVLLPSVDVSSNDSQVSLVAYTLEGEVLPISDWQDQWERGSIMEGTDVVILHTPGHSPGSITLYRRASKDGTSPGILFTGDTYAYTTRDGGKMTGFGRYGNNLEQQVDTLAKLLKLEWDVIAAGHGHSRDYRREDDSVKAAELRQAQEDLVPRLQAS